MSHILVTGAAGFIGMNTSRMLLERGDSVVGLDNLNDYYSVQLKRDRLDLLSPHSNFTFQEAGLEDREAMTRLFSEHEFDSVHSFGGSGGRPLFAGESSCLCGCQPRWIHERSGRVPSLRNCSSGLRVVQFRVWRQPRDSVSSGGSSGPSGQPVRGHQKVK